MQSTDRTSGLSTGEHSLMPYPGFRSPVGCDCGHCRAGGGGPTDTKSEELGNFKQILKAAKAGSALAARRRKQPLPNCLSRRASRTSLCDLSQARFGSCTGTRWPLSGLMCLPDAAARQSLRQTARPTWMISRGATPGTSREVTGMPSGPSVRVSATCCSDSTTGTSLNLGLSALSDRFGL